jgi:hypothetical protein
MSWPPLKLRIGENVAAELAATEGESLKQFIAAAVAAAAKSCRHIGQLNPQRNFEPEKAV